LGEVVNNVAYSCAEGMHNLKLSSKSGFMGMLYKSTMGIEDPVDMRTMVLKGKPGDGGLYLPLDWNEIKPFSRDEIKTISKSGLVATGYEVGKRLFGQDLPDEVLLDISEKAFGEIDIPLKHIHDDIYITWLDRGPTGAFKDFAARYMALVMGHYAQHMDRELVIVVATSGDTGSAIANAFYGVEGIKTYIMYPRDEVTEVQAALMNRLGGNVYARAVDAKFDDLQTWAQALMDDEDLKDIYINSANSIHYLRFAPQTIYHMYSATRPEVLDKKGYVIKADASGNFGNSVSDIVGMKYLGAPVKKIIPATNINNAFPKYMKTVKYKPITPSKKCISNAMNVGNASNLRRLFDIYGGRITKDGEILKHPDLWEMEQDLFSTYITDWGTRREIKRTKKKHDVIMGPHTAVPVRAARKYKKRFRPQAPIIATGTAAPWKFGDVLKRLGIEVEIPEYVTKLMEKENLAEELPGDYQAIKEDFRSTFGPKIV
jgi:threonine synthase